MGIQVNDELMKRVAELLREQNAIDAKVAAIMHQPMTFGHLGEWIASQVFDSEYEQLDVIAANS